MHLFADITAHGLGHLAMLAPVINALAKAQPAMRLTVRSKLPEYKLRQRIRVPFAHIVSGHDFGFEMLDALRVDLEASAQRYQSLHENWSAQVDHEVEFLRWLAPDLILTSPAYLPLAAGRVLGIPSVTVSCLNWADLFSSYFGEAPWARPIREQMQAAYQGADAFLAPAPAMPMTDLPRLQGIGPIVALGQKRDLGLPSGEKAVLIAYGGMPMSLPMADWPELPGVRWLIPQTWPDHPRATAFEPLGLTFTDLLASVDAVITKPGYGMFTESACNGTPVLYQRRDNWPEQDALIPWLEAHGRAREVSTLTLTQGDLAADLTALWALPARPLPQATGVDDALRCIQALLG